MKKLISYVLVFVLGFAACAYTLKVMGYAVCPNTSKPALNAPTGRTTSSSTAGLSENPIADAAAKVGPAVVNIDVLAERRVPNPFGEIFGFELPTEKQILAGKGSGVIIDKDGYIVTNNHVVAGADKITVTLADGRTFKARLVGRDSQTDLAVLKIDARNLPCAKLGNSDNIRVGDWAIAIGNPLGLGNTVTVGVISATKRTNLPVEEGKRLAEAIQTDAAINRGNSGGPLANVHGEVIGINTAIYSTEPGQGNIGIGFAIPINPAKAVIKQLIEKGKIVRPQLGVVVADLTGELAAWYKQNGFKGDKAAVIFNVLPGTAAEKAGLMQGDLILEIDGKKVKGAEDVTKIIQKCKVGQVIRLTIWRSGQTQLVGVRLREMRQED
jgi:serine protease Do